MTPFLSPQTLFVFQSSVPRRDGEQEEALPLAQRAERRRQEVERQRREEEKRKQWEKEQTEDRLKNELKEDRRRRAEELRSELHSAKCGRSHKIRCFFKLAYY